MDALSIAKDLLESNLQLGGKSSQLTPDSALMGSFPEFNSLSIAGIIAGIEEMTGCEVLDTEISEDVFQTVGTLADFIDKKLS